MAKQLNEKQLSAINEIVLNFKQNNPLTDKQRYTFNQLFLLGNELQDLVGETKLGLVYFPYHTLWYVLKLLDASLTFTYHIIDYTAKAFNDGFIIEENKVKGLSIYVEYTSTVLPTFHQVIPLALLDAKNQPLLNITADEMDFGIQRAFVKSIAFNTGLGLSFWLTPSDITATDKPKNSNVSIAASGLKAVTKQPAKPAIQTPTPQVATPQVVNNPAPAINIQQPAPQPTPAVSTPAPTIVTPTPQVTTPTPPVVNTPQVTTPTPPVAAVASTPTQPQVAVPPVVVVTPPIQTVETNNNQQTQPAAQPAAQPTVQSDTVIKETFNAFSMDHSNAMVIDQYMQQNGITDFETLTVADMKAIMNI